MFQQIPAPEAVVAVAFSGKITKDDIRNYESILEEKLNRHDKVSLCVDFGHMSDCTADALVEGAKADLEFFSHLRQVNRVAMVSDKEWPQALLSVVGAFIPHTEIKCFPESDRPAAVAWAAEAV
jgi:hypothetical protein